MALVHLMKSCNWSIIVQSEADSGSIASLGPVLSFCSQAYCVDVSTTLLKSMVYHVTVAGNNAQSNLPQLIDTVCLRGLYLVCWKDLIT